ncbi:endonuclease domain-containing protein [Streptomyces sp. DfronAA-171]|uniref:endonuclease domain-containing protein n=2 Tax=Streptomyces TaxID=1883 RepID=UPI00081E931B|nr:Recombination endonuclease VII [Streptomyces sp. DfronAA-171]
MTTHKQSSNCSSDGCERRTHALGLCNSCYEKDRKSRLYKKCEEGDCIGNQHGNGLCSKHYQRWRNANRGKVCEIEYCAQILWAAGLCRGHYKQKQKGTKFTPLQDRKGRTRPCKHKGCTGTPVAMGYCNLHYIQWNKTGSTSNRRRRARSRAALSTLLAEGLWECCLCNHRAPIKEFAMNASGSPISYCRPCVAMQGRLRRFQLSETSYAELLKTQGGRSAICRTEQLEDFTWHIDHDHTCCPVDSVTMCGKCIRGLLCHSCNTRGLAWYERLPTFTPDLRLTE